MVLSSAYCPPIEFFALLLQSGHGEESFMLEAFEHYQKQSWRTRCNILSSSGPLTLTVPVVHDGDIFHKCITDIMVDYSTPWVARTEYAIDSAYFSSPFFEYYRDELFSIWDSRPERLWDLNMRLADFFRRKIGISAGICVTREYMGVDTELHPKKRSSYVQKEYWQVFGEKLGFTGGLSVMDLLFNEGPESICLL